MKLKKDSVFTGEYRAIKILLWISVALVLLGVIVEFAIANDALCGHKNFIENILLGASASSLISYITLYIPYKNKKEKEKEKFNLAIRKIAFKYKTIYTNIEKGDSINARKNSKELIDEIGNFTIMYNKMNFFSKEFEKKSKIISGKLLNTLIDIPNYLDKVDIFINDNTKKLYSDEEYVELSKKIYSIVIDFVNETDISDLCSDIELFGEATAFLFKDFEEIIEGLTLINNTKKYLACGFKIQKCYDDTTKEFMKKRLENRQSSHKHNNFSSSDS